MFSCELSGHLKTYFLFTTTKHRELNHQLSTFNPIKRYIRTFLLFPHSLSYHIPLYRVKPSLFLRHLCSSFSCKKILFSPQKQWPLCHSPVVPEVSLCLLGFHRLIHVNLRRTPLPPLPYRHHRQQSWHRWGFSPLGVGWIYRVGFIAGWKAIVLPGLTAFSGKPFGGYHFFLLFSFFFFSNRPWQFIVSRITSTSF